MKTLKGSNSVGYRGVFVGFVPLSVVLRLAWTGKLGPKVDAT
jgi:hypothetical protein